MRILIANDLHWPYVSGVASAVKTLAQGLSQEKHTVMVLAPSSTGRNCKEREGGYDLMRIRSLPLPFKKNLRVTVSYDREIKKVIEDFKPDIIHVHTQMTIGLTVLRVASQIGIPAVATNHLMPDNLINNVKALTPLRRTTTYLMNEYGMMLYKDARRIIMPTESVISMFNGERTDAPIVAISNGIDLSHYSTRKPRDYIYDKFDIPRGKRTVLWVGRLDGEKHLDIALRAFAKLAPSRDDLHFVMVGQGNAESDLIDLVEDLGIAEQVTFTGLVSEEDKYELHRVPTMFVVPSPNELQCLAMLESMACGKPVVAVDAGALAELVYHDENGYLVSVDDVDGFSRSMAMILDKPERIEAFGKRSRKNAEVHDVRVVIKRFVGLYKEVIQEAGPNEKRGSRNVLKKFLAKRSSS